MTILKLLIGLVIVSLLILAFVPDLVYNMDDECCSICGSSYAYGDLEDGKDITWDYCGGLGIALDELWTNYNNGGGYIRSESHLGYLEDIRLEFYPKSRLNSFDLINLSNPCPQSPDYKWMATGYISDVKTSRDVGYSHLVYMNPVINNVTYYMYMTEIPADEEITLDKLPINYSHIFYVYKQKHNAWHWHYRDAKIVDGTESPRYNKTLTAKWNVWRINYNEYLLNDGVDVGDQFWM